MKIIAAFGIIAGLSLILASFFVSVPTREISAPTRYVGGDAYNFIIEASIRGGEIAGAKTTRALYLVGGIVVFFGSLIAHKFSNDVSTISGRFHGSKSGLGSTERSHSTQTIKTEEIWICKKCGTENPPTPSYCKGCGEYR